MAHADSEHGLRVQLATALKERDEARHGLNEWCKAAMQERARVTAAESERDALRAEVKRLREALERYGRHDRECVAGIVLCACGLDAARQGSGGRQ